MATPLMQRIRDLAAKWQDRATTAQPYYEQAVSQPQVWDAWKNGAVAAAPTYNAAMQQVIAQNRWGSAIQRTDPRVYGENVRAKAARRAQGIQLAGGKWQAGIAPIFDTLDRILPTLPARGPKMSAENINRFNATIRAIHEAALARRGVAAGGGVAAYMTPAPSPFGYIPQVKYPTPTAPQTPQPVGIGGYGGY